MSSRRTIRSNLMSYLIFAVSVIASQPLAAATFEKLVMPGPLSEAHAEIEDNCNACHAPLEETPQHALCAECHAPVTTDIETGTGFHGRHPDVAGTECQTCHREHEGREATTLAFDMTTFSHNHTDFPLLGAHAAAACASCHVEDVATFETPSQCASCHAKEDVHNGAFGNDCASCHNATDWRSTLFDHAHTGFPLLGAHAALTCSTCHGDDTALTISSQCSTCHAQDDVHNGRFGATCDQCHGQATWTTSHFDHQAHTGFALNGGHAGLTCNTCHTEGALSQLGGSTCISCHAEDDPHGGAFGNQCGECHTSNSWQSKTFSHAQATGFALIGAHQWLSCEACHEDGDQRPATTCAGCHEDPHDNQLGSNCETCHDNAHFTRQVLFDHALTTFPLVGKHADLSCLTCHANARFHDAQETCAGCHQQDDVHEGRLGSTCGQCHTPGTWTFTHFDHGNSTDFALTGAHAEARCEACHARPAMMRATADTACHQCHRADDIHSGSFGNDCAQCHTTRAFNLLEGQ